MYEKWLNLLIAYCGTLATYFYGGWNEALSLLAILAVLDFISGMGASITEGIKHPDNTSTGLSSKKGFKGITKKAAMFIIIAVLFRVDSLLGLNGVLSLSVGATYFYISNELISLFENYGRLGLPMPDQLKQAISILKAKSEESSNKKGG